MSVQRFQVRNRLVTVVMALIFDSLARPYTRTLRGAGMLDYPNRICAIIIKTMLCTESRFLLPFHFFFWEGSGVWSIMETNASLPRSRSWMIWRARSS